MILVRSIIVFLFSYVLLTGNTTAATIRCSDAAYAGKKLIFGSPSDPVTNEVIGVFTLNFDANGKSSVAVKLSQTTYVFCDFGVYRGMLFLEPGDDIVLKLPPFREKSFAEQKNPYFSPVDFWFVSESGQQLTDKISKFEQQFNTLVEQHFNQLYIRQSKVVFDSIKTQLNQIVPVAANKVLQQHKKMEQEVLAADIFRKRPEAYSAVFNTVASSYWLYPAFIMCFNKTFDKQLSFSALSIKGAAVKKAVETQNLSALAAFVEKKYKVSGEMADLVLLKLLHDGFYSGEFSQQVIANMVASGRFTKNRNRLIRETSENITRKFTFLQKGSPAPVFCLLDLGGKKVCSNAEKSKFKYIVFADVDTRVCREHLKYLQLIDKSFNKSLKIYIVLRDTEKGKINNFFNANIIPGEKLQDKENQMAEKYKVCSYPQCFLLDKYHRVVLKNAKAPLDGFQKQFGTILHKAQMP